MFSTWAPVIMALQDTSHLRESNPRPTIYETVALPTELRWLSIKKIELKYNFFEKETQR